MATPRGERTRTKVGVSTPVPAAPSVLPRGAPVGDDGHAGPPAPSPETVAAARAYLTPRYAVGAEAFLWEAMELPMPDLDAIGAVVTASGDAQGGRGDRPGPIEVTAALVVLEAVRLAVDQMEARLLGAALAAAMGWEQIAAILGVSVEAAEERHRRLKLRLDEPIAEGRVPGRSGGRGNLSRSNLSRGDLSRGNPG